MIEIPGFGYKVGDLISSSTVSGGATISQLLKVTAVNSTGGITAVSTVKFGCGYTSNFLISALKNIAPVINSKIKTTENNVVKYSSKDTSEIDTYIETGTSINPNTWGGYYSDPFYTGIVLNQFYNETSNRVDMSTVAYIRCYIGAVAKYQGYYTSNDGFLDDVIKLQDSKFYQKYSYLLTVDEKLESYKTYLRSFIHTAGLALFSEYQIQNDYEPGISGQLYLDEYISKATFVTKNKTITKEYIKPMGMGGVIRKNPYDMENYFAEDSYNPPEQSTFTG